MRTSLILLGFLYFGIFLVNPSYAYDLEQCDFLLLPEAPSPKNPHSTVKIKMPKILYGQLKSTNEGPKRLIGAHSSQIILLPDEYRKKSLQGAVMGKDGRIKLLFRKKYGQGEEVDLRLHSDFSLPEGYIRNSDGSFSRDLTDTRIRPFPIWVSEKTQAIQIELRKLYASSDGNMVFSRSKTSTLPPLSWLDEKVEQATHLLLRSKHKVARRASDGSILYRGEVFGMPWVVIVDGKRNVTASFPTGENLFSRIDFSKR